MKKAFTLIELIIVIAVIAILAAIITASYNSLQARSRDTKRIADVQAIGGALRMYKSANKVYPVLRGCTACFCRVRSVDAAPPQKSWRELEDMISPFITRPLTSDLINTATSDSPVWNDLGGNNYTVTVSEKSYLVGARLETKRGNPEAFPSNKNFISGCTGSVPALEKYPEVGREQLFTIYDNLDRL